MHSSKRTKRVERYYMACLHPASAAPVPPLEPVGLSAAALQAAGLGGKGTSAVSGSYSGMSQWDSLFSTLASSLDGGSSSSILSVRAWQYEWGGIQPRSMLLVVWAAIV